MNWFGSRQIRNWELATGNWQLAMIRFQITPARASTKTFGIFRAQENLAFWLPGVLAIPISDLKIACCLLPVACCLLVFSAHFKTSSTAAMT
jgi:hypothetical protein